MKKQIIFLVALLITAFVTAQKSYVQGYFVKNNGEKTECQIESKNWDTSPFEISYKTLETDKPLILNTDSITVLDIPGYAKFIRKTVQIDKSGSDINSLSPVKNPEWQTDKILIKVLVEGRATLYKYSDINLTRFFYSLNDSCMTQLVYKSYQATTESGSKYIGINNNFRQQLFASVNNPNYKYDLTKIMYEEKELTQYFEQYNAQFETPKVPVKKTRRDFFKASVMAGINYSGMLVKDVFHPVNSQDFGSFISPTIGAEIEFILPFSAYNWSILLQPTFNSKISGEINGIRYTDDKPMISKFSYLGIDIPLGIRYRYNLKNNFKISATGYFYSGASSWYDMTISIDNTNFVILLARAIVPGVGIGVDYKNFGLELKAIANRDFIVRQQTFNTNFNVVSLNLKYQFVDLKINL